MFDFPNSRQAIIDSMPRREKDMQNSIQDCADDLTNNPEQDSISTILSLAATRQKWETMSEISQMAQGSLSRKGDSAETEEEFFTRLKSYLTQSLIRSDDTWSGRGNDLRRQAADIRRAILRDIETSGL